MPQFGVRALIDQYTQIPRNIQFVEERLAWMRNWTSFRGVKLEDFPLFHVASEEDEATRQTSSLASDVSLRADSIGDAVRLAYEDVSTKLNLLSVITMKGFTIMTTAPNVGPSVQSNRTSRLYAWLYNYVSRRYWETRVSARYTADSSGHYEGRADAGVRLTARVDASKYQRENYEIVADMREAEVKRDLTALQTEEIERRWIIARTAFVKFSLADRGRLRRAIDLYMASRMNRDLYSRFMVMWSALDSLTPNLDRFGEAKTEGMAEYLGEIQGYEHRLDHLLQDIYQKRNDITHSRRTDEGFPRDCKQDLLRLERVFVCYILKRLGLPQLPANLAP